MILFTQYQGQPVVDSKTKLIHSVAVILVNALYSQMLEDLLHGNETRLWGDSAYAGQKKLLYEHAPHAKEKGCRNRQLTNKEKSANQYKSKTRSRVEPIFGVMKL